MLFQPCFAHRLLDIRSVQVRFAVTILKCSHKYKNAIDAESSHQYRAGCYHPLAQGDYLKNARYNTIDELGWGDHSTASAAKDKTHNCSIRTTEHCLLIIFKGRPSCYSSDRYRELMIMSLEQFFLWSHSNIS